MMTLLGRFLSPSRRKLLRDLWLDRKRTLVVVASLMTGVFTIGTVIQLRMFMAHDMAASFVEANPASAIIFTAADFDQNLVDSIRMMPEVADAEGRRSILTRFKRAPEDDWHPIELFVVADYDNLRVNKLQPELVYEVDPVGWPNPDTWPPPRKTMLLERTALLPALLGLTQVRQDDTLIIDTPSHLSRAMRVSGLIRDFSRLPPSNAGRAYGYITPDTAEWLEAPRDFNELHLAVAAERNNKEHIAAVTEAVRRRIERTDIEVARIEIPEPGKLPLDAQVQAITLLLGVLGVLALLMGCLLMVNSIQAFMARQIREIGIIKAIGGRSDQVRGIYLSMILIIGLLALIPAILLGSYMANGAIRFMAYLINFNRDLNRSALYLPPAAFIVYLGAGLLIPVVIALHPINVGSRISVLEALGNYGLTRNWFEFGRLDRLAERIQGLSPVFLLAVRNVLRKKRGLLVTLIPLILASATMITVFSVQSALRSTLNDELRFWQFDLQLRSIYPFRAAQIKEETLSTPGVAAAEAWGAATAYRERHDGSKSGSIYIMALPATTALLQPSTIQGRWLVTEDENALVVNSEFLKREPDASVGQEITLHINGRESVWLIVGVVQMNLSGFSMIAFANYPYFSQAVNQVGQATLLQVVMSEKDTTTQAAISKALQDRLTNMGVKLSSALTAAQLRVGSEVYFGIVITFMMSVAIPLAIVGSLGLAGAISIKVIERRREIGVLRAIGASDSSVLSLFLTEGITIGVVSWFAGACLALPLSKILGDMVGMRLLQSSLRYSYSLSGALIWLIAMIGLTALTTYLPAKDATRISVREALKYE